ncbi:MAG TPA: AMP-binding protein [Candidatus Dormibacteraeota bacterium]|nr:AMP-binding protein [Candidatus Dormibacteraeota bacterium]
MDVGSILERTTSLYPDRPAVIDGDRTIRYRELDDRVNRLANAMLGSGLKPGDRVIDLQHNAHQYIEADLALSRAGLVRVPVNTRLTSADWAFIANDSKARGLIYGEGFAGAAEELLDRLGGLDVVVGVEQGPGLRYEELLAAASPNPNRARRSPSELVSINYSSGTTGRPKGCMRTVGNRLASTVDFLVNLFEGGLSSLDVWLHAGPITHASGLFVLPHIAMGACQVVLSKFDPLEAVGLVEKHHVTGTVWVPTMIERVIANDLSGHDLASLRRVAYAGSPMAPDRIRAANAMLAGRMVQFYGMVEAIPPLTVLTQKDHDERGAGTRLGSAGRPCLGVELEIVGEDGAPVATGNVGELVVGGEHVMAGYWGMEEATGKALRDGRLWTGDMAWRDDGGYITIVDRKNDMIISGGYNVYPREVEDLLKTDPSVADAVVLGVPDPDWGQAVTAVVVVRSGTAPDRDRLFDLCRRGLAQFKRPKRIDFVDSIPQTPAGKINRKAILELVTKTVG